MRARAFSLSVAFLAAAALVSASGAATTKGPTATGIDVSTRTAVIQYLRSIHVNPTGVVIQRGARNYAGPNCPGKGWSCTTTTHPVVQVASADGANTFNCTSARCAVVQVAAALSAAPNAATCIKTTGLIQSCTITQSSSTKDNKAIVYENAGKLSGVTQTASYTASVTQQATGASNSNTACVYQAINLNGSIVVKSGPVSVALEAHQSATIQQDTLGSGANSAQYAATPSGNCDTSKGLTQSQTLTSTATGRSAITQNENDATSLCGDGVSTDYANMCLDIEQNQDTGNGVASGPNNATLVQTNTLTAVAKSPSGPISQTQSSSSGGLVGTINQDSSGVSNARATQTENQCEDASRSDLTGCHTNDGDAAEAPASLTQTQYGPVHKGLGTATQTGNGADSFTINQSSTQNNDQGAGSTQQNDVQGDCSTSGNCTVNQTTNVDGQTTTNTQSGQNVNTSTTCTGSTCTGPAIIFDGSPGTNAPPSTLGPYTMTAFGADSQPACPDDGSVVTGVSDPTAGTIGFDEALRHDLVGGPCWATWSNGYAGDVYDTTNSTSQTQVTITLPSGTQAFYFYAEPNDFSDYTITATAQDGTTSGPVTVNGDAGAKYFGFYGINGATLASITVTTTDVASETPPPFGGFAIGEFGISPAAQVIG